LGVKVRGGVRVEVSERGRVDGEVEVRVAVRLRGRV
jgi:hypothetical protein